MSYINNMNSFDKRVEQLNHARAPSSEVDAAISIYEHFVTAIAICDSHTEAKGKDMLGLVFEALNKEAHRQSKNTLEE